MKYLDIDGIREAFFAHLAQTGEYTEEEAEISFAEFPDPFGTAYLLEEYLGDCEIDGEQYSRCASWTDFWSIPCRRLSITGAGASPMWSAKRSIWVPGR